MMKLGIIINTDEKGFQYAKENGLAFLEICHNVDKNAEDLVARTEELKGYIEKYGVKIGSIGRWGAIKIDEKGEIIEEELKQNYMLIDVASELGCEVFVTGVNYVKEISEYENISCAIKFLQLLVDYGKKKNVKIATNNCDWGDNFVRSPEIWKYTHGQIKELGIKYDPSHCINCGSGRYLEEIADWGKRFYHVHIKGTINIDGRHIDDPPAGLDMINWGAFMGALYEVGYDGNLSIEPHSHTWRDELGAKGVAYTIDMMKKMIF